MSDPGTPRTWRVLAVDDEPDVLDGVKALLEGAPLPLSGDHVEVLQESSFEQALAQLDRYRIDLVILDIRLQDGGQVEPEAGLRTSESIREVRFVPIVFYTAHGQYAGALEADPFAELVTKGDDTDLLLDSVDRLLNSGAPFVQRALVREVEEAIRSYMVDYVAPRWAGEFIGDAGKRALAHILARRLSAGLTFSELPRVMSAPGFPELTDAVSPVWFYLTPPVGDTPKVGDLHVCLDSDASSSESWWIVVTPSCDLAWSGKADFALLAKCMLLEDSKEFQEVKGDPEASTRKKNDLKELMKNKGLRWHYLPAAFDIPHLRVDFQNLQTIAPEELRKREPRASLDSPFAEELQSRFSSYLGRIGTEDLDLDALIEEIQERD